MKTYGTPPISLYEMPDVWVKLVLGYTSPLEPGIAPLRSSRNRKSDSYSSLPFTTLELLMVLPFNTVKNLPTGAVPTVGTYSTS
ncbi:hypothetical protein D3C75_1268630 [compost metagenome]